MLEEAVYAGDETNPTKIEIINHLLGRADCEYIEEKVLMSLEEAKKKKKRKRTPKVTYLTGFPFLNDHRFNHACGTCDCGKDAADNTNSEMGSDSTGEGSGDGSLGGDSAGEGGAMGESFKLKESWEDFNFEDHNSDDVVTVVIVDKRFDPLFKKDHKESLSRNNVKVEGHYFNGIVVTGKVGDIIQVCDECRVMNPAKIFMGDTGSLYLGALIVSLSFVLDNIVIVLIYGGIFVIEAISDILQVMYFKLTKGKRLFLMAPLHHHFEKRGWSENKIVCVFSLINVLFCILAFISML
jgi:hypothetical protein